jgi:hypothetical protein
MLPLSVFTYFNRSPNRDVLLDPNLVLHHKWECICTIDWFWDILLTFGPQMFLKIVLSSRVVVLDNNKQACLIYHVGLLKIPRDHMNIVEMPLFGNHVCDISHLGHRECFLTFNFNVDNGHMHGWGTQKECLPPKLSMFLRLWNSTWNTHSCKHNNMIVVGIPYILFLSQLMIFDGVGLLYMSSLWH